MKNIVTYKFKYTCQEEDKTIIRDYINKFNNLVKCTYNFMYKTGCYAVKDVTDFQKTRKNVPSECGFRLSALYKSKEILNQQKTAHNDLNKERKRKKLFQRKTVRKICFGGKNLYTKFLKGLITKEEFIDLRNIPIYSVGEKNSKANRYFRINDNIIVFQPREDLHINLSINISKNHKQDLQKLQELQELKAIPITYELDLNYVYVTFDLEKIREKQVYKPISNRIMSMDLNPNYIGYVICDWSGELDYKIIDSGTISIEELNEYDNSLKGKGLDAASKQRKYVTNKRNYEICNIAKWLVNLAKHYRCELFAIEKLDMNVKDLNRGRKTNRLCNNQWNRDKLVEQLTKRCKLFGIKLTKVAPNYSSFIGNLGYRQEKLPDMCLAALEIGRRCYELDAQYTKKTKEKKKNIVLPEIGLFQKRIEQALEEIGYIVKFSSLLNLYNLIKKSKIKYRFLLRDVPQEVFSFFSVKSKVSLYKFIQI